MSETLKVETEEQVPDTIKWAVAERKSLDVRGTGSKSKLGRPMKLDHVLDLSALTGVKFYKPAELVLSAGAATPVAEVERCLTIRASNSVRTPTWACCWATERRWHAG